jgi:hypothetical protein
VVETGTQRDHAVIKIGIESHVLAGEIATTCDIWSNRCKRMIASSRGVKAAFQTGAAGVENRHRGNACSGHKEHRKRLRIPARRIQSVPLGEMHEMEQGPDQHCVESISSALEDYPDRPKNRLNLCLKPLQWTEATVRNS